VSEKISNFLEETKEIDGQVLPIECETLLRDLQSIRPDIASEYITAIEMGVEMKLLWKNIIASSKSPSITKHFIENLSEEQFRQFQRLVRNLASKDVEERVNEIVESTFGFAVYPVEASIPKAQALLDKLKEHEGHYEAESDRLAILARDLHLLAKVLAVMNLGESFIPMLHDQLSKMPESDLDRLLGIACVPVVNNL